jgi:hypothetical protein
VWNQRVRGLAQTNVQRGVRLSETFTIDF